MSGMPTTRIDPAGRVGARPPVGTPTARRPTTTAIGRMGPSGKPDQMVASTPSALSRRERSLPGIARYAIVALHQGDIAPEHGSSFVRRWRRSPARTQGLSPRRGRPACEHAHGVGTTCRQCHECRADDLTLQAKAKFGDLLPGGVDTQAALVRHNREMRLRAECDGACGVPECRAPYYDASGLARYRRDGSVSGASVPTPSSKEPFDRDGPGSQERGSPSQPGGLGEGTKEVEMTEVIGPQAAAVNDALDEGARNDGAFPRWDEADAYFWAEGTSDEGASEYHWWAGCGWLATSLARDGTLVTASRPPSTAIEAFAAAVPPSERSRFWGDARPHAGLRWLCRVCETVWPQPDRVPLDPSERPCATCECPQLFHEGPFVGIFNHGCWMAWCEVVPYGPDPDDVQVGLLHCRCDGYVPSLMTARDPVEQSGPPSAVTRRSWDGEHAVADKDQVAQPSSPGAERRGPI